MTTDQKLDVLLEKMNSIETLMAAIVPYRRLPQSIREKVDKIGDGVSRAFRGERAVLVLEEFEKVVNLSYLKKGAANIPKEIRDGTNPVKNIRVLSRIIPYALLMARLAQKKAFRPTPSEISARHNVEIAIQESGLIVSTLGELKLRMNGTVPVVLEKDTYEERIKIKNFNTPYFNMDQIEKGDSPVIDPKKTKLRFKEIASEEEPAEEETVRTPAVEPVREIIKGSGKWNPNPEPEVEEPTTTPTVESRWVDTESNSSDTTTAEVVDDVVLDENGWDEDEQPEHHPFLDFRLSGELEKKSEKKSRKAIDLFAEEE